MTLLPPCLPIFFAVSYLSTSCFCSPVGASDEKACLTPLHSARPNSLGLPYEYSWSLARYSTRVRRNNRRVDVSTREYGRSPSHKLLRTSTGIGCCQGLACRPPHSEGEHPVYICTSYVIYRWARGRHACKRAVICVGVTS